ncbi:hypothetical protein [Bacteroides propionicifaciens]|uniref:hypothetical protein n=1 Tax=Bacteroides propionicifaciens TaxID=392838 RepID=UPI00037876BC|nr:hypothetical protein [Bacteroides propionicifaciens]
MRVSIPTAVGRGVIEDGVANDIAPNLSNIFAYVMRGTSQVAKLELSKSGSDDKYAAIFRDISLNGTERVVVSANNYTGKDVVTPQGYKVGDIQSSSIDGKDNVAAIYYFDDANLSSAIKSSDKNKTEYKLDNMELKPQASRVEVSGAVKSSDKLVKSVEVTEMTPNNYSLTFGAVDRFMAQSTGNTVNPSDKRVKDNLGVLANVGFYADITTGGKVVANHLFNGDEKRIAFRMNAVIYDVVKDDQGNRVLPINSSNVVVDSYVYKATGKAEGSEDVTTTLYIKDGDKYYALTKKADGELQFNGEKYTKSATAAADDPKLDTYSTVEQGAGYFNMVKFASMSGANGNEIDANASKFYEQGKIYKVFFDKIDWNGDGTVDDNDAYDPDKNGDGGTSPSTTQADVVVGAKVMKWTVENTGASIE